MNTKVYTNPSDVLAALAAGEIDNAVAASALQAIIDQAKAAVAKPTLKLPKGFAPTVADLLKTWGVQSVEAFMTGKDAKGRPKEKGSKGIDGASGREPITHPEVPGYGIVLTVVRVEAEETDETEDAEESESNSATPASN